MGFLNISRWARLQARFLSGAALKEDGKAKEAMHGLIVPSLSTH